MLQKPLNQQDWYHFLILAISSSFWHITQQLLSSRKTSSEIKSDLTTLLSGFIVQSIFLRRNLALADFAIARCGRRLEEILQSVSFLHSFILFFLHLVDIINLHLNNHLRVNGKTKHLKIEMIG